MCAEGQYQNLTGQSSCKSCDENTASSVDRTTCVGMSILSTFNHLSNVTKFQLYKEYFAKCEDEFTCI